MPQSSQSVGPGTADQEPRRRPIPPRLLKLFMTQMRFANLNAELLVDKEWYGSLISTAAQFMANHHLVGILYKPDDAVRQYLDLQAKLAERKKNSGTKTDPTELWEGIIAVELQGDNWA